MKLISILSALHMLLFCPSFIQSSSADYYLEKASQAINQKDGATAKKIIQQAYAEFPTHKNVLSQLATIHFLLQEYEQAAFYFQALTSQHPNAQAQYNLGSTYCKLGRFNEAVAIYESLFDQLPNHQGIQSSLLKLYARTKQFKKVKEFLHPRLWWFDENICGSTILLDLDKEGNGLGDSIMFIRYARDLAQAGAKVIVRVQKPLVPLFSQCPYITSVITKNDPTPVCDKEFSICIVSLMSYHADRIAMNAVEKPYLAADSKLIEYWHKQLAHDTNLKIGLCWESNFIRDSFTGQIMPSPRAISLDALQPLAMPNVSFYSLHKKAALAAPFAITQFGNDFDESHGRFMDTAAVIMNCDLIITVDTSIAHLAGALGKPTWLLLSCESDYRWFTQDSNCYWYPSMQLFRQKRYGDWGPVVAQVKVELEKLVKS